MVVTLLGYARVTRTDPLSRGTKVVTLLWNGRVTDWCGKIINEYSLVESLYIFVRGGCFLARFGPLISHKFFFRYHNLVVKKTIGDTKNQ